VFQIVSKSFKRLMLNLVFTHLSLNGMKKRLMPNCSSVFFIRPKIASIAFRALIEDVIRRTISSALTSGFVPPTPSFGEHASKRRKRPSGGKLSRLKDGSISSVSSSTV